MEAKSSRRNELDYWLERMPEDGMKNYIENRVIAQMNWFKQKSRDYKKKYEQCTIVSIIASALIPIISIFADGDIIIKVLIATLGSVVTAISAFLSIKKYKELSVQYRSIRENLLSILVMYFTKGGLFEHTCAQDIRNTLLVNVCEQLLMDENKEWKSLNNKD